MWIALKLRLSDKFTCSNPFVPVLLNLFCANFVTHFFGKTLGNISLTKEVYSRGLHIFSFVPSALLPREFPLFTQSVPYLFPGDSLLSFLNHLRITLRQIHMRRRKTYNHFVEKFLNKKLAFLKTSFILCEALASVDCQLPDAANQVHIYLVLCFP